MASVAVRIKGIIAVTAVVGASLAWTQTAYATALPTVGGHLLVADGSMTSWTGTSVGSLLASDSTTAGDVAVLGIRGDQTGCASGSPGAIQILHNDGTRWVAEQRIGHPEPLDTGSVLRPATSCAGEYGESVSTDGTSIAVAARFIAGDVQTSGATGAAYIYERDGDGVWAKTARVRVPTGPQVDAVAIQADRLAVSASTSSGSRIYLYAKTAAGWQPDGDFVGRAPMAVYGDQILYSNGLSGSGADSQFLAERTGSGWVRTLNFRPRSVISASAGFSDGDSRFGVEKVILDGSTATVAQRVSRSSGVFDLVELYRKVGTGWTWEAELADPDAPGVLSLFGFSAVSRDGDQLVVGASAQAGGAQPPGAAYVFARQSDGTWTLRQRLRPQDPLQEQAFGYQVALDDDVVGVLSRSYDNSWGAWFSFEAGTAAVTGALNHPASGNGALLGYVSAVDGDLAAALTLESVPVPGGADANNNGAVRLFRRTTGGSWTESARLTSPGTATGNQTGLTPTVRGPIAVHNGSVYAVGTTSTSGSLRNVLLRFDNTAAGWGLTAQISPPDAALQFISSVTFAGDQMVLATTMSNVFSAGRVDFLREVNGVWTRTQSGPSLGNTSYVATNRTGDLVAMASRQVTALQVWRRTGTTWGPAAVVSSPFPNAVRPLPAFAADDSLLVSDGFGSACPDNTCQGKAAVFESSANRTSWTQAALLGGVSGVYDYGVGIGSLGNAFFVSRQEAGGVGVVDVIERQGGSWTTTGSFTAPASKAFDYFGETIASDGTELLVSAIGTAAPVGQNVGAVYAYVVPPISAPPPPTAVTATPGDHSATITWLKPASDGGSAILGYTVTASPGGQTCSTADADTLSCTITGLTNGVDYTFTVTARNAAGTSPPAGTPAGQPTTVGTPPAPVTVLTPEPDPADGTRVTLHWLAAQSDPNLPVIGYTATAQPGGRSCSTTGELFCTITGLDPAVSYTFTVVAVNGVGPSPTTRPDPPTAVTAAAGGYGQAVVSWTPPQSTGGTPVTAYTATADGAVCTASATTTCTATGLTPGATYVFTVTATNAAGTSDASQPAPPFTVGADITPPTVVGHAERNANGAGWYDAPVTITWTATDPPLSSGTPTTPAPTSVTAEGANQLITSGPSCDPVANCATGTYGPVNIDRTDPTISSTLSPQANGDGWVNRPATIAYACDDALSGIASCPSPVMVGEDVVSQVVMGMATDNAGNTATASTTVRLDTTPPAITAYLSQAANGEGWNNADVTVSFTCSDSLSGVASCPSPATLTDDGADQVVTRTATDRAGNVASATVTVSIDKTRPLITATRTAANSFGWNNSAVTVTYTCADALSGIATCPASDLLSTEGAGQSTTAAAADHAGNTATATSAGINIDRTAPTITATVVGTKNAAGWYRTAPTIHYSCADALSGIATCPADLVVSSDGAAQIVTATAVDHAGNTATAMVTNINVDTSPPLVAVTGAVDGTTYQLNQLPAPVCVTSDATSGITSTAMLSLTRTPSGVYTATCSGATDRADNTTPPVSITYTVVATTTILTGLTNQYVSASGQNNINGVIHSLDNHLADNQICLYISKVGEQVDGPQPTLTAAQAAELIYWARQLDGSC